MSAVVIGAALISVVVVYKVSMAPPALAERETVQGEASIEILVDSARSPIADAKRDLTGLTARASVFARLIAGGNIVGQIARKAHIPPRQIDVAGPLPLPGEAPGFEPAQIHPYGISITAAEELPILIVATRAPTVREARALAAAAPGALKNEIETIQDQQGTPPGRRVEFRLLGPAEGGHSDAALGKKVALGLFVVLSALGMFLILGIPRFRAAWQAHEPDEPSSGDPNGAEQAWPVLETQPDHEILQLPSGRGSPPEQDDAEDRGPASILHRE